MQNSRSLPISFSNLVRAFFLILLLGSASIAPAMAGDEVLPVIQDAFVKGGDSGAEVMPHQTLEVAARTMDGMNNVRKTFLQFDVDSDLSRDAVSARVVLTAQGLGVLIWDGDPREQVELVLFGLPDAEWDEKGMTWENAPGHDHQSATDDGNPNLEPLARTTLDPLTVKEDDKLSFSDPRLLEYLRKHPGIVTFLITSNSPQRHAGFNFFSKEGSGNLERRPKLILEKK